jgi:hypothetical protein
LSVRLVPSLCPDVIVEGNETPNGEGGGSEGRPRRGEGDLLAERRARRAAESGEVALTRRAEAAEATVQTLERHVASLQQRLREVEDERRRTDELLEAERAGVRDRERELRRVKQREYAEQQLRVEAEERASQLSEAYARVEVEGRVEVERLDARLSASEEETRELARELEDVRRQLAEAEQDARAQHAASTSEQGLQTRLGDLERRALEIQRGLDAERTARERSEQQVQDMRDGHRRMESLLGEMRNIVAKVSTALAAEEQRASERQATLERARIVSRPAPPLDSAQVRGEEMADALAAAVERLRARAELSPAPVDPEPVPADPEPASVPSVETAPAQAPEQAPQPAPAARSEPALAAAPEPVSEPAVEPAPRLASHKHSLSLIGRLRNWRKQRKSR